MQSAIMFHVFEKSDERRNDRVYYLIFLVTATMSTVVQSVIIFERFSRKRKSINYSFCRRLANFQEEEIYNPSGSYIIKLSETEATAITNFPRSSFYQKASRTWIINFTLSICAFKDLQSTTSSYISCTPAF